MFDQQGQNLEEREAYFLSMMRIENEVRLGNNTS